jgi:hypothetical protein
MLLLLRFPFVHERIISSSEMPREIRNLPLIHGTAIARLRPLRHSVSSIVERFDRERTRREASLRHHFPTHISRGGHVSKKIVRGGKISDSAAWRLAKC